MIITMYELLGMIKDGKAPKKVKYKGYIYQYQYNDNREANIINYYYSEENHYHLIDGGCHEIRLNDEVEILEEKKIPEKLDVISWDKCIHDVTHKEKELAIEINKTQELLNQVIDYLKRKGDE